MPKLSEILATPMKTKGGGLTDLKYLSKHIKDRDIGGSGEQIQSDWNQSDDTQVDYIKNKPTIPAGGWVEIFDIKLELDNMEYHTLKIADDETKTFEDIKAAFNANKIVRGNIYTNEGLNSSMIMSCWDIEAMDSEVYGIYKQQIYTLYYL